MNPFEGSTGRLKRSGGALEEVYIRSEVCKHPAVADLVDSCRPESLELRGASYHPLGLLLRQRFFVYP
eukprot:1344626-Amorphochlora_amoeboformis.AAC.1